MLTVDRHVWIALLRGVNVGGRVLPMKELVASFTAAGCADVRSYIQSGNVVFRAPAALAARVPAAVSEAVAARFGFPVQMVLRTPAELARVAKQNPFLRAGADPAILYAVFLAGAPNAKQVAALDPGRSPPDEFAVRGREIYLRCPEGLGRTKLTNQYFDAKLATVSTVRNWRTVLKLVELAHSPSQ